ncbi:MAG: M28 family peptidase [Planctomycetota bacterium]|jgi:hypothetical protein|nr:M28 family peptidase [Planctomycetota bacterium]
MISAVLFSALLWQEGGDPLLERVATITEEECMAHVSYLASPELQGRGTGSPGFEKAAVYVEEQLLSMGLEPAGKDGSFRLPWELPSLVSSKSYLTWFDSKKKEHNLEGASFTPVIGSKEGSIQAEPVFVGFAIDARNERWQDLPPKKVKGKVVFAFTREPKADNPKSKTFDGIQPTKHSSFTSKVKAAYRAGAEALVIVPDPAEFPDTSSSLPGMLPIPLFGGMDLEQIKQYSPWPSLPVVSVSLDAASEIFDTDLEAYYQSLQKKRRPVILKAPKKTELKLSVHWEAKKIEYQNLGAWIRGSDGDGEALLLGAHLDHVGLNYSGEFWGSPSAIHPGADDNASGSAALLEVAEGLSETKPKEDILFVWFSGEELGLLGSRAYCRKPIHPLESTIAMLNMDQIARTNPKSMNVGGLWDNPKLLKLVKKLHKRIQNPLNLDTEYGRDLFTRSDHYSFYQKGVPSLFFFEGNIDDNPVYHKPGDVPGTIQYGKMTWVAREFLALAWALAFEGERP